MNGQSILNELYKEREDEISSLEENDKKNLEDLFLLRKQRNEQLENALCNIPKGFTEVINNLKSKIQNKLEIEHDINGYFSEKAYKKGFSDGINLIMECKLYANNYEYKKH